MTIEAKVIAHSSPSWGEVGTNDICTLQLTYPRFIHSEFMTHRMFSRNASSSRAIPVEKQLQAIRTNPAAPIFWGSNKPGMQAGAELEDCDLSYAKSEWFDAAKRAARSTKAMVGLGVHKQIANRIAEPWSHIVVVVTATEWENFFKLRISSAAQPEIKALAVAMRTAMEESTPEILEPGVWHMPYASPGGLRTSVAGCARVSYKNHDSTDRTVEKDVALHEQLLKMGHLSPFEHQATPVSNFEDCVDEVLYESSEPGITHVDREGYPWSGNFKGWIQYRQRVV